MRLRLGRGVVIVVPLTSSINKGFLFQVLLAASAGLGVNSEGAGRAHQIRWNRTVSAQLDDAFRLRLELWPP
jgi:mRNA-degrading endonuclease toxin of MazEF toxin-antitoxin module